MRTREEHLAWCKERALEYLHVNDVANAITSMMSDLSKHPETKNINAGLTMIGMMYVKDRDVTGARRWIEGFR